MRIRIETTHDRIALLNARVRIHDGPHRGELGTIRSMFPACIDGIPCGTAIAVELDSTGWHVGTLPHWCEPTTEPAAVRGPCAFTLTPSERGIYPNARETLRVEHGTRNGRYRLGWVPIGEKGVREFGGPTVPGPWAYVYALSAAIDNHGGSAADDARAGVVTVRDGDTLTCDGYTWLVRLSLMPFGGELRADLLLIGAP